MNSIFDPSCRRCPRLAAFLDTVSANSPTITASRLPPFGDPEARLLIVGLAPGMHGANRTGRPFTGDHAGILLYGTLHKFGFASAPVSVDPRTASVSWTPASPMPSNACRRQQAAAAGDQDCNAYLQAELEQSPEARVLLALGTIAHTAVLRSFALKPTAFKFAHGAEHALGDGRVLLDSYHCSRYNTQTRRLTAAMFEDVVERARALLGGARSA